MDGPLENGGHAPQLGARPCGHQKVPHQRGRQKIGVPPQPFDEEALFTRANVHVSSDHTSKYSDQLSQASKQPPQVSNDSTLD